MPLTEDQISQAIATAADNTPSLDSTEPGNVPPEMNDYFASKFGVTLDQLGEVTEALGTTALEGLEAKWAIASMLGLRTKSAAENTIRTEMMALAMSSIIVGIELGKTLGQSA